MSTGLALVLLAVVIPLSFALGVFVGRPRDRVESWNMGSFAGFIAARRGHIEAPVMQTGPMGQVHIDGMQAEAWPPVEPPPLRPVDIPARRRGPHRRLA